MDKDEPSEVRFNGLPQTDKQQRKATDADEKRLQKWGEISEIRSAQRKRTHSYSP
jgi:hypothetical protein